jgi:alpha-beta hydrolase superfamily lysophospholipase
MLTARPSYDPDAAFEVEEEHVEYRRDGATSHLARLYRPRGAGPFPTLLLERGEDISLPPTLVVAGTADGNVPNKIVDRFVAAYRARGGQVELARFEGAPHGFGNQPRPDAAQAIAAIKRFVAAQVAS